MEFSEFAHLLYSAISGGEKTEKFARILFEAIVDRTGLKIIDDVKDYSFKNYYNGSNSISGIAKKINAYVDSEKFESYLDSKGDAAGTNLAKVFKDDIPDAEAANISQKLAELFVSLITDAAGAPNKKRSKSRGKEYDDYELIKYYEKAYQRLKSEEDLLTQYYNKVTGFYSTKKTLLYAETPHLFYEIYVCNDIVKRFVLPPYIDCNIDKPLSNTTLIDLESTKHAIIQGTGGIGKSMYLTHLLLSYKDMRSETTKTPVLIQLKEYSKPDESIVELILNAVKVYVPDVDEHVIVSNSESGKLILLLDGLDEISASLRKSFNKALEDYIKAYPNIMTIVTSRPTGSFVSYSTFTLFEIKELSRKQAIELVKKLEFWDLAAKEKFLLDLDRRLYDTHHQFASNPLLLTIMLMTYSSYADVPAKMHHFYAKAYETMARLHDASKGSYVRPLNTGLTPEAFSDYFAQFCARTYYDEVYEFTDRTFHVYMKNVIKKLSPDKYINPNDFLLDLTVNLCIMYREGEKIHFIHRSFQEYFAALFFSTYYDEKLKAVGEFFENKMQRFTDESAFDMLYDMIPEKIERFVFLPYLDRIFNFKSENINGIYWNYLIYFYPTIYYYCGETNETYDTVSDSFLYEKIISNKGLSRSDDLDFYNWPNEVFDWHTTSSWYEVYSQFLDTSAYKEEYVTIDDINPALLKQKKIVEADDIPDKYYELFGTPDEVGLSGEIAPVELLSKSRDYKRIIEIIENDDFPLKQEFLLVKRYWEDLVDLEKRFKRSNSLFDD